MRAVLLFAFLCSGAAGLVYELVWSRYLALFVGHSAVAQVLVIAMFLGGMSVGALTVGKRSRRVRRPLLAYASIELALAVVGLAFHSGFRVVSAFSYQTIFPALASPWAIGLWKWSIAGLLIFLPSILLGATFPLMAAGVIRAFPRKPGGTIAALYFVNSLGGAIAVLAAGFVFVAAFGLPGTSASAAALNLTAALLAAAAALAMKTPGGAPAETAARDVVPSGAVPRRILPIWRLLLAASALTAVASFVYEIAWIRMLSLVMGSATHSFELMLSAFILGLALGAIAIRRQADRSSRPLALLGGVQLLMGLLALATLPVYAQSFGWIASLVSELPATEAGYRTFSLARYGLALAVMLPATALAGMTLPLITSTLLRVGAGERAIGWVYATNTAGAVVGVMLAGLVLMPALGLKGMLVAGAALDMALGVVLLGAARRGIFHAAGELPAATGGESAKGRAPPSVPAWLAPAAAVAALLVAVGTATGVRLDRATLTSGVFRSGETAVENRPVLYYADGRTATIGVHVMGADTLVVLTSNGKPDASLSWRWMRAAREPVEPAPITQTDESTQMLTAVIAGAHARGGRAAVIGQGSGISGHFLLADPTLESLVTIEIEPRVIDASYVYYPANARVFDDPRSHIVIGDAKSYFAHAGVRYDLILSEPSNPWVSGTASLFSLEFYDQIRRYLSEEGVFGQWFQLYETSDEMVTSVLAALHASFPAFRGYLVGEHDLMIVATVADSLPDPDWSLLDDLGFRADLAHVPRIRAEHLDALQVFTRAELTPLLEGWETPNSDYRPVLDLGSERTRFLDTSAEGVSGLVSNRFRIAAALGGWRRPLASFEDTPITVLGPLMARSRAVRARRAVTAAEEADDPALAGFAQGVARALTLLWQPPAETTETDRWAAWVYAFVTTEAILHAGSAGYEDTAFYARVLSILEEAEVPPEVETVVAFLRGLAGWDFEQAARAGASLIAAGSPGSEGGGWTPPPTLAQFPPSLLLDGTVVAALRIGDTVLAADAYQRLAPVSGRGEADFRMQLLRAHISRAQRAGGLP